MMCTLCAKCIQSAYKVHTKCIPRYALCMHFVCTLYALCMHFVCKVHTKCIPGYALCMHFVCTLYALCMHFVCTLHTKCICHFEGLLHFHDFMLHQEMKSYSADVYFTYKSVCVMCVWEHKSFLQRSREVLVTSVGLLCEASKICGRDLAICACQLSLVYELCFICVCASAFHAPANCS